MNPKSNEYWEADCSWYSRGNMVVKVLDFDKKKYYLCLVIKSRVGTRIWLKPEEFLRKITSREEIMMYSFLE
ncbi:Uncharacterised protein [uncultured archaeon]|nr:Uncharacterised protein [uncultured archaeon]